MVRHLLPAVETESIESFDRMEQGDLERRTGSIEFGHVEVEDYYANANTRSVSTRTIQRQPPRSNYAFELPSGRRDELEAQFVNAVPSYAKVRSQIESKGDDNDASQSVPLEAQGDKAVSHQQ